MGDLHRRSVRYREGLLMVIAAAPRVDVQRFHDEGYLLIEDVFDPVRDLDPVVAEYEAKLDRVATQWAADGTIASTYADQIGRAHV